MPAARVADSGQRAGTDPPDRPLWLAALWTGAGTAALAAVAGIVAVAVCWLPASGGSGSAGSAIRAGLLTFLAALHGGITVDGVATDFVPLGMTLLLGGAAWRAGTGLAAAAEDLGERRTGELLKAVGLQAAGFAAACAVAAGFATLGTSSVSVAATVLAAVVLFAVSGGVAFARGCALGEVIGTRLPGWAGPALRAASIGVTVYLGAGALLVAGALVAQHGRVEALSAQVGGGWSGLPILLLGILAAPNAVIAAAAYLAGPGFAVGAGSGVSVGSTVHGTLPAFPVLGAVPSGPANALGWALVIVTPVVAGVCVARSASRSADRWRTIGYGAAGVALAGMLLGWQGGGGIGSGRLHAVGASPWQLGFALGGAVAVASVLGLGLLAALARLRPRPADGELTDRLRGGLAAVTTAVRDSVSRRDSDEDELAG